MTDVTSHLIFKEKKLKTLYTLKSLPLSINLQKKYDSDFINPE